jgi:hypothetical protein
VVLLVAALVEALLQRSDFDPLSNLQPYEVPSLDVLEFGVTRSPAF